MARTPHVSQFLIDLSPSTQLLQLLSLCSNVVVAGLSRSSVLHAPASSQQASAAAAAAAAAPHCFPQRRPPPAHQSRTLRLPPSRARDKQEQPAGRTHDSSFYYRNRLVIVRVLWLCVTLYHRRYSRGAWSCWIKCFASRYLAFLTLKTLNPHDYSPFEVPTLITSHDEPAGHSSRFPWL